MFPLAHHLAELVRRPSINPMGRTDLHPDHIHESRVTDYWEARFRELGVPYERLEVVPGRSNIIATYTPPTPPTCHLLFEAHQDTVPIDGMVVEPFAAKIENGRLYGRGACDVKAGGVAMFGAFERLVKDKPAGSAAVTLAFTIDEEHTFLGIQHLMKSGFKADFAVVAEPTRLNIVRSHKGVVRWGIETHGVACHSSRPEKGVNAVYRMGKVLTAIETYAHQLQASRQDALLGAPTICVGMIHGGASPNTVPDHCSISVDRRLLPGETAWEAIADLTQFLNERPEIVEYHVSDPSFACPALVPKGGEDFVARLGKAIDSVKGSHTIDAVPYGTDASTVQEAGIPTVVFGPGDIAQAHTKDEWVELAQVEQAAEVLWRFATLGQ